MTEALQSSTFFDDQLMVELDAISAEVFRRKGAVPPELYAEWCRNAQLDALNRFNARHTAQNASSKEKS